MGIYVHKRQKTIKQNHTTYSTMYIHNWKEIMRVKHILAQVPKVNSTCIAAKKKKLEYFIPFVPFVVPILFFPN